MRGRENWHKRQTDRQTDRGELCREERIGRIDRQKRVMQGRENRQNRQTDRQRRVMQERENRTESNKIEENSIELGRIKHK